MSEIDKSYVAKYLEKAENTNNEAIKNDCLYRVATQMEVIPCDGNTNLSKEQQEAIVNTAKTLLNDEL
ncbi:hypothetical protein NIES4071_109830 (plasmid) [Calothrix sp. NIES-4071]|nr:hypothetical protein NIES4071_109830 [Calothrix sp. NIES-4071]BAZ65252.1 hypothetical protein NIES4105_109850 [Calothrix sp. NIES-4105]